MIDVNESLTRKVADLARLELSDAEVKTFTSQLGQILNYVETLSEVNVENVEPMTHALELQTPMRDDVVRESPVDFDGKPKVLQGAPDVDEDGYKVPPIIGGE